MKESYIKVSLASTLAAIALLGGLSNLKYGLSFIDEGMYLTDAWRLSAGDKLISDTAKFAPTLYQAISSPLFVIFNNISILQFRTASHLLAAICLISLISAVYKKRKGDLPSIIAVTIPFFYTGLDQTGMSSSLNYYTIAQALLYFYVTAMFPGEQAAQSSYRKKVVIDVTSTVLLTGMIITYLPLAGLVPIHIFLLTQNSSRKTLYALSHVLLIATVYGILISSAFEEHVENVLAIGQGRKEGATSLNSYTPVTVFVGFTIAAAITKIIQVADDLTPKKGYVIIGLATAITSISIYNHYFGILPPFWNGWFNIPGITSAITLGLLSISITLNVTRTAAQAPKGFLVKGLFNNEGARIEALKILILMYGVLYAATSTLGIMLFSNILPLTLMMMISENGSKPARNPEYKIRANSIAAFGIALGIPLMMHDHQFTYFDKSPNYLTSEITHGPAKGIFTNELNSKLYSDLINIVDNLTEDDDFIISFDQTPMTYFITKRRPSLDHSWTGITGGDAQAMKLSIAKMVDRERIPRLALHWRNKFLWFPSRDGEYALSSFGDSAEPVLLSFVKSNMRYIGSIEIQDQRAIEIYGPKNDFVQDEKN